MLTTLFLLLLSKIFNRGLDLAPDSLRTDEAWAYVEEHAMNKQICILIDYGRPSGSDRLWVWDFDDEEVLFSCPVAHGRGHSGGLMSPPQFSNEPDSFLSSLGHAAVGERYEGRFGISYRLDGLDSTNSNIRQRAVVLHGYRTVPPKSIYPLPSGRSRGCVMVAKRNMALLDQYLQGRTNVLIYTYCNTSL